MNTATQNQATLAILNTKSTESGVGSIAQMINTLDQTLSGTGANLINFSSAPFTYGSSITASTANKSFTVKDLGIYKVNVSATITSVAAGIHSLIVNVGGVVLATAQQSATASAEKLAFNTSTIVQFSSLEVPTITFTATQPTAGAAVLSGTASTKCICTLERIQ